MYELKIKEENEENLIAFINAKKYKLKLDCMYDEVFRPVIKYSQDESRVLIYEEVWQKLFNYLEME